MFRKIADEELRLSAQPATSVADSQDTIEIGIVQDEDEFDASKVQSLPVVHQRIRDTIFILEDFKNRREGQRFAYLF